jgi:cystathionine beta-lyase/cystathionine gamma-synthase
MPGALLRAGGTIVTIDLGTAAGVHQGAGRIDTVRPEPGRRQTTLSHPPTSHRGQDPALLARAGITPGTIRVSVGLEDPDDVWQEFQSALDGIDSATMSQQPGRDEPARARGTSS